MSAGTLIRALSFALASFALVHDAAAQATTNLPTRFSGPTIGGNARSATVCFNAAVGTPRTLGPYSISDANIGESPFTGFLTLTRGNPASTSQISMDGAEAHVEITPTTSPPGFTFIGRLANINQALQFLRYTPGAVSDPTDRIDLTLNDFQDPRLLAQVRFWATPAASATAFTSCSATLDLVAESDTGDSSTDDITSDATPTFLISPVPVGATVQLRLKEALVAEGTATSTSILLTQTDPLPEQTDSWSYDVVVDGGPPSAEFTIAYVFIEQPIFANGFE